MAAISGIFLLTTLKQPSHFLMQTLSLCFCLCRNEEDKNHTYSVVTRVPVGFQGKLACHRLEQSYKVGPLEVNRETVFRSSTSLQNNRTLFTDNNGYQMMKRTYKNFVNNTVARVMNTNFFQIYLI